MQYFVLLIKTTIPQYSHKNITLNSAAQVIDLDIELCVQLLDYFLYCANNELLDTILSLL